MEAIRDIACYLLFRTGFRQVMPFLAPELDRAVRDGDGEISLYLNVVAPTAPNMYFVVRAA
jgi:hypothetical protein